jgi:hypothetical protein
MVASSEAYLNVVRAMPEWLGWLLAGLSFGAWLFYDWKDESRLIKLWKLLTEHFTVRAIVQNEPLSDKGNLMSIEALLRFRRPTKGHLWLRVFHCTGMGRTSREEVIDLGEIDQPKGGRMKVEIARRAVQFPGWEPVHDTWGGKPDA